MVDRPPGDLELPYARPHGRGRTGLVLGLIGAAVVLAVACVAFLLARGYTLNLGLTPPPPAPSGPVAPAGGKGIGRAAATPGWIPPPPAPAILKLPAKPQRFTISQRDAGAIPGSGGTVYLSVDDITAGQVQVEVRTSDGRHLARGSVRQSEGLEFALDGARFVAVAEELHNHLIGQDVGVFVVRGAADPPTSAEEIARLIAGAAAENGATVVWPTAEADDELPPRNDGAEPRPLAQYLENIWFLRRAAIRTPRDLVRESVRPLSATSGTPVLRFPDGQETTPDKWLAAKLDERTP